MHSSNVVSLSSGITTARKHEPTGDGLLVLRLNVKSVSLLFVLQILEAFTCCGFVYVHTNHIFYLNYRLKSIMLSSLSLANEKGMSPETCLG